VQHVCTPLYITQSATCLHATVYYPECNMSTRHCILPIVQHFCTPLYINATLLSIVLGGEWRHRYSWFIALRSAVQWSRKRVSCAIILGVWRLFYFLSLQSVLFVDILAVTLVTEKSVKPISWPHCCCGLSVYRRSIISTL